MDSWFRMWSDIVEKLERNIVFGCREKWAKRMVYRDARGRFVKA